MSSYDAYQDEMGRFLRLSDEELSRLLAGEAGACDEAFDEVASLLGEVRGTFAVSAPDEKARALHLAAISETAQLTAEKGNPVVRPASKVHGPVARQVSGLPKWRRVMDWTKGFALKAFAGTIAASTSMMGLAYAGVDLPGQAAERAIEAVTGVELPNQGSDEEAIADETSLEDDGSTAEDEPKGSRATGEEKSAAGRAKAAEKSGGRSEARGSDASAEGRATASEASEGASDAGADNAGTNDDSGRATADGASNEGRATGSSKAEEAASGVPAPTDRLEDTTETEDDGSASEGATSAEQGQSNNPTGKGRP